MISSGGIVSFNAPGWSTSGKPIPMCTEAMQIELSKLSKKRTCTLERDMGEHSGGVREGDRK